jgi:WD40 repeat protein
MNDTVKFEPTAARQIQEFKHDSPLLGCRFNPSGCFVFAGCQENTLLRWELETGQQTKLAGHTGWVRALACTDRLLFSGDYHGRLLAWPLDADEPKPLRNIEAHVGWVRALVLSPDGKTLASCGNDRLVKLWSVDDGRLLRELSGHVDHVWNIAFHPDGGQLVSADLKGVVKVWNLADGKPLRALDASALYKYDTTFNVAHGGVRALAFDGAGKQLLCVGATNSTNGAGGICNPGGVLFDWAEGKQRQRLLGKEAFTGPMWAAAWHPAGCWLGTGVAIGGAGALWFWKGDQPTAFHTLKLAHGGRDLHLHPDGRRLAIAHTDGAVRLYDLSGK